MKTAFKYFCFFVFLFCISFYLPRGDSYAQEKKISAAENDTLLSAARQYIKNVRFCALVTNDSTGFPHVRTMDPFLPDEDWIIWFGTNPRSRKVNEIRNNPKVALYYTGNKGEGYVTITGYASLVNNQSKKDSLWKDEWSRFYKNRKEDYLLIKVIPKKLEMIDYKHGIFGNKETWETPSAVFNANH